MPGAVLEIDAARWVMVASAVGVGIREAPDGGLCPRPAGDLDAERGVVAADVGARECLGHRAASLVSSWSGGMCL